MMAVTFRHDYIHFRRLYDKLEVIEASLLICTATEAHVNTSQKHHVIFFYLWPVANQIIQNLSIKVL